MYETQQTTRMDNIRYLIKQRHKQIDEINRRMEYAKFTEDDERYIELWKKRKGLEDELAAIDEYSKPKREQAELYP